MEIVIDYETLEGAHGEDIVKELSIAAGNVLETLRFLPPTTWNRTAMRPMV
jgi:hypothetical protein